MLQSVPKLRDKKQTKGMKINIFIVLFFLKTIWVSAQTKGIVVDENNLPIPYVNIWVEGENIGTTSEEDGTFVIDSNDGNKNLIFSILGFEKKIIKLSEAKKVVLQSQTNELDEIVIVNKKETKEIIENYKKDKYSIAFFVTGKESYPEVLKKIVTKQVELTDNV